MIQKILVVAARIYKHLDTEEYLPWKSSLLTRDEIPTRVLCVVSSGRVS